MYCTYHLQEVLPKHYHRRQKKSQKNEFVAHYELAVSQHFDNHEKGIMLQQSGRQCQKMDANNLIWTNHDLEASISTQCWKSPFALGTAFPGRRFIQ